MKQRTHIVVGIAAGLAYAETCGADVVSAVIGGAVSGIAAIMPDFDTVGMTGKLLKPLIGHRGASHSLVAVMLISLICRAVLPGLAVYAALGYATHVLLDMFNITGVGLLWPFYRGRVKVPLVRMGGILENLVIFPSAVILLVSLTGKMIGM
ncbi:Inner membrane protein YdjM [Fervidicola ferrireducens]|uniref:Inner membrane protein YdjM n=2 Tax=Fervidicola ferrireducens TaxID=520764 RepID=A0A140L2T8_9FIRM|nr:Inner membrane protein YdjM [Fervidicola ferrireducens]